MTIEPTAMTPAQAMRGDALDVAGRYDALGPVTHTFVPYRRTAMVIIMGLMGAMLIALLSGMALSKNPIASGPLLFLAFAVFVFVGIALLGILRPPPIVALHEHGLLITRRNTRLAIRWTDIATATAHSNNGLRLLALATHTGEKQVLSSNHHAAFDVLFAAVAAKVNVTHMT